MSWDEKKVRWKIWRMWCRHYGHKYPLCYRLDVYKGKTFNCDFQWLYNHANFFLNMYD